MKHDDVRDRKQRPRLSAAGRMIVLNIQFFIVDLNWILYCTSVLLGATSRGGCFQRVDDGNSQVCMCLCVFRLRRWFAVWRLTVTSAASPSPTTAAKCSSTQVSPRHSESVTSQITLLSVLWRMLVCVQRRGRCTCGMCAAVVVWTSSQMRVVWRGRPSLPLVTASTWPAGKPTSCSLHCTDYDWGGQWIDWSSVCCSSQSGVVNIYSQEACLNSANPKPLKAVMNLLTSATSLTFNPTSEILAIASRAEDEAVRLVRYWWLENNSDTRIPTQPVQSRFWCGSVPVLSPRSTCPASASSPTSPSPRGTLFIEQAAWTSPHIAASSHWLTTKDTPPSSGKLMCSC